MKNTKIMHARFLQIVRDPSHKTGEGQLKVQCDVTHLECLVQTCCKAMHFLCYDLFCSASPAFSVYSFNENKHLKDVGKLNSPFNTNY